MSANKLALVALFISTRFVLKMLAMDGEYIPCYFLVLQDWVLGMLYHHRIKCTWREGGGAHHGCFGTEIGIRIGS